MLKLEPHEVCPNFERCKYKIDVADEFGHALCKGGDPNRPTVFICDFYKKRKTLLEELITS